MNTKDLKAYAPKARRDFIAAVTKQAQKYGVTEAVTHPVEINGDVCVVNGKPFPASMASRINKLGERVKNNGFEQTMEQAAYSWFNRLIAIRYMELHDYLGHGRRVLSHPEHPTGFQILEECTELTYGNSGEAGELPDLTHERVVELKLDGTKDEELYRELLLAQCHALHKAMPFLFETIDDETELLLPENLTKTDSLIHDLITDLAESDWESIEVVGWLYQFYISEKKDEVMGKVVKSEDIPAATQLFTPNWIVKYMVQNSLGAQWLATYPESPLKAQMEYYIEPAEQADEVNTQLKAIIPESLNPEELTLIDPASGSGHILVEAYDLFKAIYLERGYRSRDIARLILRKNIFGLDIDERAAQMSGFALMMKGRADDRRLFEREVKLNVTALQSSISFDAEDLDHNINLEDYGLALSDLRELKNLFEHATSFGSLIQVPLSLKKKLPALKKLSEIPTQDMFLEDSLKFLAPQVRQAELLAAQYDAVVANPPYMGSGGMNILVKKFAKDYFPNGKNDLFACFIERAASLALENGRYSLITMPSWLFLGSFEKLRENLLSESRITSLLHMGRGIFGIDFGSTAFSIQKNSTPGVAGNFFRLHKRNFQHLHIPDIAQIFANSLASETFKYDFDTYRSEEWGTKIPSQTMPSGQQIRFSIQLSEFKRIPGSPLAYWVSDAVFRSYDHPLMKTIYRTAQGSTLGINDLFLRLWHEVSTAKENWVRCQKGGPYRKWWGNNSFVLNWGDNGRAVRSTGRATIRNADCLFNAGISWSNVSSGSISAREFDDGYFFESTSSCLFQDCSEWDARLALAILNSKIGSIFLQMLGPTMHYQTGDIDRIPVPAALVKNSDKIFALVDKCVAKATIDWNIYESSWGFQSLPYMTASHEIVQTIEFSYSTWNAKNCETIVELKRLEEESNHLFIDAYGLQDEFGAEVSIDQVTLTVNPAYRYGVKGTEEDRNARFREDTMKELVSYAIGCMMGRYSLDEPGLIYANSGNQGFDASRYTKFPADDDGIIPLTDKEWFADDAANRIVEFISVAWDKAHLEENLDFLAANLSPKKGEDSRDTIRRYLCDKFYKDHMQTYKKRPIYWLFSSGKQKAFQCLVYLHRYNESTLARMRTEYVIPLTAKLSSHIEKLENDKGASGSAAEIKKLEKEIKNLHKQQTELTEFDEKLKHYADMRIPLDLDDGVKVNYGKFGDLLAEVKAIHGKKSELN